MNHWIVICVMISICRSEKIQNIVSVFHITRQVHSLEMFPRVVWTNMEILETSFGLAFAADDSFDLPVHLMSSQNDQNFSQIVNTGMALLDSCRNMDELEMIASLQIQVLVLEECEISKMKHWPLNLETRLFTINKQWRVREIYKIDKLSEEVISQDVGTYDPKDGFNLDQPLIWHRRQNLYQHRLRVGHHAHSRPMFVVEPDGSYRGYLGNIFQQLKETLNFSITLVPDPSNRYGALVDGKTFDGLVGMIQKGHVDLGIADISVTQDRLNAIEILEPCWVTAYKLLLKRPNASIQWTTYLRGYDGLFWTTYFALILILMAVSCGLAKYWNIPLDQILGHFFGSILNREITTLNPKMLKPSLRILLFSLLMFSFVVFATYNAILTSFLATREISIPVKTVADFLKPDVKLALKAGTATYDMFRRAKEGSLFQQVYDAKIKPDKLATFEGGSVTSGESESNKTKLLNLGYYMILDATFHSLVNEDPCTYIFAPFDKFLIDFNSLGLTKDSPLKNLFNFHLRRQRDSGLWHIYKQRMFTSRSNSPEQNDCSNKDDKNMIGLELDVTIPAFFVFACGIGLSLSVSFIEKLYSISF